MKFTRPRAAHGLVAVAVAVNVNVNVDADVNVVVVVDVDVIVDVIVDGDGDVNVTPVPRARAARDNAPWASVFDLFRARAEAAGTEVHRVLSPAAAIDLAAGVLERERVEDSAGARAVWCDGPILERSLDRGALSRRFRGLSFEVTRERAAGSRVGLSEMEWALAATGTVAQDASDPAVRLASMLPETHVAFVRTAAIVPDLGFLLQRVDPRRARYLAFVTGPSRTADIERVLTIGVHGPRRLVVVCVDDAPGPC